MAIEEKSNEAHLVTRKTSRVSNTIDNDFDLRDAGKKALEVNERDIDATSDDILASEGHISQLSLKELKEVVANIVAVHETDTNFPGALLDTLKNFLERPEVLQHPEEHIELIANVKLEVAVITNNSPYSEVRAVVDNTDDPTTPCSTIRAWVIGLALVSAMTAINQIFGIRQPSITVDAAVVQLIAYPLGKAAERYLPDIGFSFRGVRHSINPGKFTAKEHMLITIMGSAGHTRPYSNTIIWTQFLKKYFNQSYSGQFSYQILLALSTDFMGYGLAGLCRVFLVFPSYCIFPRSLVTIALNKSLHNDDTTPIPGPFGKWRISRYKFFLYAFIGMFVYFWFPDYIFEALSVFNWLAWIAPNNINLAAITGINHGLGLNPLPTFDWNMITADFDPLVVPLMATLNSFAGLSIGGIMIVAFWYTNTYFTGYLPINSNSLYTHTGSSFNVSAVVDERGVLDEAKYQAYSPAYMAASNLVMYSFFFASYAATVSYALIYQRHAIMNGFRRLFQRFSKSPPSYPDVHQRLMARYREVPEWWYLCINIVSIALGIAGVAGWQTYTNVGVVFFGVLLSLVFLIPIGIIYATTGISIGLNVLAEFLGGALEPGNALSMNFFKSYGYVATSHAMAFIVDLKLAHYSKIPPRQTFIAQIVATLISCCIATGILNFQIRNIPDVCESDQKDRFTCPGINTFFTAAVLFGSMGARKIFGRGGQYTTLLAAFPIGFIIPFIAFGIQKRFPRAHWIQKVHPVVLLSGGMWWSPYNFAYMWPAIPLSILSMGYIKSRYLSFWSRYNYVLSAAFSTAIAVAAIIIYFALEFNGISLNWWGNAANTGCESTACKRLHLPSGEYFGRRIGNYA